MPTLLHSQCTLSNMDDSHRLSNSTCPPSPQDNGNLELVAVSTSPQNLAVFRCIISTSRTPSTVHVITPVGNDYVCESSATS